MKNKIRILSLLLVFIFLNQYFLIGRKKHEESIEKEKLPRKSMVLTGIEVLKNRNFKDIEGKRIGLLTNPSGVDKNLNSTIDILFSAKNVNLVALYGPEHGVRGDAYAGDKLGDDIDTKTGLKVYSLYGKYREPSPDMLEGIDMMVYDIQDVGSRSYTFISTLALVMRACAKKNIPVMVLDRPNPLGGLKVEGAYVEEGFYSFVSQFKIPYVYGLTVGELAMLINEECLNRGQKGNEEHLKCKLSVIPMHGWKRDMLYDDTLLPWVSPSPQIPYSKNAVAYSSAGICGELNNYLNIGIGYTLPFSVFGAEWIDADKLYEKLNSYEIEGVKFRVIHYKPMFGSRAGKLLHGVQYFYTNYEKATITLTQFYVMQAVYELYPAHNPFLKSQNRLPMFDKVTGSEQLRLLFSKNLKVEDIIDFWNKDVEDFRQISQRYYLY